MNIEQTAKILGEDPRRVKYALSTGKLRGEMVPDPNKPGKNRWAVTASIEEAREAMATITKRTRARKGQNVGPVVLPSSKDLYRAEEAAKLAGVGKSTVHRYLREVGVNTLQNGKAHYIARSDVQKLIDHFRPAPKEVGPTGTVVPPVAVSRPDPRIDALAQRVEELGKFLVRFAASCGFTE